ncbi:MAG: two pore domain potassium channel family protein [Odoribacter sp.]|nr:two pore domain potassium channel family protein [Odoribacter sp.]
MKQENRIFEKFLNVLVLLGSLFIIIIVSIELLSVRPVLSEQFILNTHLIVCFIFLLDFFVRWFYSGQGWRFMWRNLFFFLVSIPYLNIVYAFAPTLSHGAWVALRLIPLARGIYGVSLIVNWMTSSKITNLFITYLTILFIIIYFSSIIFFFVEHGPNPLVKGYWDAFNWALMNVTTVGSNIFGVTKLGQSLAVVLAASVMIFFPIFTAYVTTKFQNKRKRIENN